MELPEGFKRLEKKYGRSIILAPGATPVPETDEQRAVTLLKEAMITLEEAADIVSQMYNKSKKNMPLYGPVLKFLDWK